MWVIVMDHVPVALLGKLLRAAVSVMLAQRGEAADESRATDATITTSAHTHSVVTLIASRI